MCGFRFYYYGRMLNGVLWIILMNLRSFNTSLLMWCIMRVFYASWTLVQQCERGWLIDDDAIMEVSGRRREGFIVGITGVFGGVGLVLGLVCVVIASSSVDPDLGWYGQTEASRNTIVFFYATLCGLTEIVHCLCGLFFPIWPSSTAVGKLERRQSTSWVDQSGAKNRPNAMDKAAAVKADEPDKAKFEGG